MNNKPITILLAGILVASLIGLFVIFHKDYSDTINVNPPEVNVLGEVNQIDASCTHAVVVIATGTSLNASTSIPTLQALNANYAASYRRLQNTSIYLISCQLDKTTSTLAVGKGILLNSSTSNPIYEIDSDNLYKGKINCISQTSTGTLSVMECW